MSDKFNVANTKVLADFPIESWPIIAALGFGNCMSAEKRKVLKSLSSFKKQLKLYGNDIPIIEYERISSEIVVDSLKEVERIFESSLEQDIKKAQGVVYTPDYIIDYILEQTILQVNLPTKVNPVLDPACGSGGFLIRASYLLSKLTGDSFSKCTELLCGIDINPKAVLNAELLLDLACILEDGKPSGARLMNCDSLLINVDSQLLELGVSGGVRALVTNPPYVKLQNLDKEYSSKLIEMYPEAAAGAFTLASLFLFNSRKYLSNDGQAGLITLNNVFTSLSASQLRENWMRDRSIYKVLDFRHFTIFDASAYTCLIFLNKKENLKFQYNAVSEMPTLSNLRKLKPSFIELDKLRAEKWRLGDEKSLRLVSGMESLGTPLKWIADIKVGFATLRDKAFMGSSEEGRPVFIGGDGKKRILELDSVVDFYKVSELQNEENMFEFRRKIIYPYDQALAARPLIPIKDFSATYPIAFEHLNSWGELLKSRDLPDEQDWHQWGRRQSMVADGPKLLTKTFDTRPSFKLDTSNSLFCNGYSVKPKEVLDSYSILELKDFLESKFVYAYSLITSFEIAGGFQCYQKNFIENICLPPREIINLMAHSPLEATEAICNFYGIKLSNLKDILSHYTNS
jgi:adenine-specific DNA-methyltransferase